MTYTLSVIVVTHFHRYSGVIEEKIIRKKKQGKCKHCHPTQNPYQAEQYQPLVYSVISFSSIQ